MTRRRWLVLGLGGLMLSAVSRVAVAGPAQIEAEGYAGSSVGQWTCGPSARANYGGVGGHAKFYTDDRAAPATPPPRPEDVVDQGGALAADSSERPNEPVNPEAPPSSAEAARDEAALDLEPHGFWLGGGGGAENRGFTRTSCSDAPCSQTADVIPPTRVLAGGRAGFGVDWDYFGVRAGGLVFQRWASNVDRSPTANVLPDIELRFGRRAGFHGGFGFGAYDVSTTLRPGLYGAFGYASGAWASDLHLGVHQTFDDQAGVRADLAVRYAISSVVAPGLGVAVSQAEQLAPEGRLFLVFTP